MTVDKFEEIITESIDDCRVDREYKYVNGKRIEVVCIYSLEYVDDIKIAQVSKSTIHISLSGVVYVLTNKELDDKYKLFIKRLMSFKIRRPFTDEHLKNLRRKYGKGYLFSKG